jgi:hypothetical protein
MNQEKAEKDLIECKRLLTRAVTDLPEFSTMEKIRANNTEFLRACDRVHKQAQSILIADILEIEKEIDQVKAERENQGAKSRISQLTYWKRLFELFFNFLLWISVGLDRSNVKKVFKGPKYGSLKYQNIDLTLKFVDSVNQNLDEFVIPLDFCSFICICDALWKIREPETGAFSTRYVEFKSGKVNDEISDTINRGTEDAYFGFFEKYGDKGIKQMARVFRQDEIFRRKHELIDAQPGVYSSPENPDMKLFIIEDKTPREHFTKTVEELLMASEAGDFAVDAVDECLVLGVIDTKDKNSYLRTEFNLRLFIYSLYFEPWKDGKPQPAATNLAEILNSIELTDWREGFGSVVLFPIVERGIPDSLLMDLLFGRKILKFFFSPNVFVGLCRNAGIDMKFSTKKQASRWRSQRKQQGDTIFDGRYMCVSDSVAEWTLGDGTFHEIFYNWVRPTSVIEGIRFTKYPDPTEISSIRLRED